MTSPASSAAPSRAHHTDRQLSCRDIDLSALNLIGMSGPLTPGQLADRLGVGRGGAVTTVVDRLEQAGYVRRRRDVEDRRRVRVELVAVRAEVAVAPLSGELAALGADLPQDDAALLTLLTFVRGVNAALVRATSRVADAHAV
ncbi:MarR family transcriptional regulator [Nocardia sp. NPDC019304]|uniref:MarR family transcriptional regulator n=1 Tax=unclassified Nocardia TaxID=2637762 RepID=UPI0033C30F18